MSEVKIILSHLGSRKPFRLTGSESFELDFLPQVRDRFSVPANSKLALVYQDPDTGEDMAVSCQGDWKEMITEASRVAAQGKVLECKIKVEIASSAAPPPPIRAPPPPAAAASVNASRPSASTPSASAGSGRPMVRASVNFGPAKPSSRASQSARGSVMGPFLSPPTASAAAHSGSSDSSDRPRALSYIDSDDSYTAPPPSTGRSSIGSFSLSGGASELARQTFTNVETAKWSSFVKQFNECVENENPEGAIQAGKELLKMDSRNVDVLYNVGVAYSTIGKPADAIDTWTKCVAIKADHALAYLGRGGAHSAMANLPAAIIDFTRAATLEPSNALAHHSLAVALAQAAKHSEAAQAEKSAIALLEKDPALSIISGVELSECWYNLGWNLSRMAKFDESALALTKAIHSSPAMTKAYSSRGNVHKLTGEWRKALADYQSVTKLEPRNAKGWHEQAICYHQLGELLNAIEADTRSIEIEPSFNALFNRAIAYALLGRFSEALKDADEMLKFNVNRAVALANRGAIHAAMGNHDAAMKDFNESIALQPNAPALNGRALQLFNQGKVQEAIRDWTDAIALQPDAQSHLHRGNAYLALKQPELAAKDFDAALALCPAQSALAAAPLVSRAVANCAMGNFSKALVDADRAIAVNPELGQAYYTRGLAYQGLNKPEKAAGEFAKACELQPDNIVFSNACKEAQSNVAAMYKNAVSAPSASGALSSAGATGSASLSPGDSGRLVQSRLLGQGESSSASPAGSDSGSVEQIEWTRCNFAPLSLSQAQELAAAEQLTKEEVEFLASEFGALIEQTRRQLKALALPGSNGTSAKLTELEQKLEQLLNGKLRLTPEMKSRLEAHRKRVERFPVLKRWTPALAVCLDVSSYMPNKKGNFPNLI